MSFTTPAVLQGGRLAPTARCCCSRCYLHGRRPAHPPASGPWLQRRNHWPRCHCSGSRAASRCPAASCARSSWAPPALRHRRRCRCQIWPTTGRGRSASMRPRRGSLHPANTTWSAPCTSLHLCEKHSGSPVMCGVCTKQHAKHRVPHRSQTHNDEGSNSTAMDHRICLLLLPLSSATSTAAHLGSSPPSIAQLHSVSQEGVMQAISVGPRGECVAGVGICGRRGRRPGRLRPLGRRVWG